MKEEGEGTHTMVPCNGHLLHFNWILSRKGIKLETSATYQKLDRCRLLNAQKNE